MESSLAAVRDDPYRERALSRLQDALGPTVLKALSDPAIDEILLNCDGSLFVEERGGQLRPAGSMDAGAAAALVRTLDKLQQKSVLLAPTGRAAKVFAQYAGHSAFTIHKKIYRQQAYTGEGGNFSLNDNLTTHTLYIVDEASMIANDGLSGSMFGTGRLKIGDMLRAGFWLNVVSIIVISIAVLIIDPGIIPVT